MGPGEVVEDGQRGHGPDHAELHQAGEAAAGQRQQQLLQQDVVGVLGELVEFMMSEPVVVQVLEGEDAIAKNREVMGATNPADAADGTIRKEFALSLGENSIHGSDGPDTAAVEIAFFFSGLELVG